MDSFSHQRVASCEYKSIPGHHPGALLCVCVILLATFFLSVFPVSDLCCWWYHQPWTYTFPFYHVSDCHPQLTSKHKFVSFSGTELTIYLQPELQIQSIITWIDYVLTLPSGTQTQVYPQKGKALFMFFFPHSPVLWHPHIIECRGKMEACVT